MRSLWEWASEKYERLAYADRRRRRYLKPGRLEDILILIQVLGLGEGNRRESSGLTQELQGSDTDPENKSPLSAKNWAELAMKHREFFRVVGKNQEISLVARYSVKDHKLADDFVQTLMEIAIEIYDRSIQQTNRLVIIYSILAGIVTALVAILPKIIESNFWVR